ncbi:LAFA_0D03466g1_1 [Lachancea sp. 'fantastica']|nr:LAFA_0D03466g1_1 [Lachancea sp. 'fantastica']
MKRRASCQEDAQESSSDLKKAHHSYRRKREVSTVIVKNLPLSYNFFKIRKLISGCGEVEHIEAVKSLDGNSKFARIEFKDHGDVLSALTKSHKQIGSNEIIVEKLQNSTIWITNFPPDFEAVALRKLFNEAGATVLSVRLPSLRYDAHRRFAYVDLISADEACRVTEQLNGTLLGSYKLVVKLSEPSVAEKRTDATILERRQITVKNLDQRKVTQERLSEEFSQFGEIEKITMPTPKIHDNDKEEPPKLNKGFAFIDFLLPECAKAALKLDECEIEGRIIDVTLSDRKAYLERQAVKRIFAKRSHTDHVVSIYPLDDKTSIHQLQNLLFERAKVSPEEIKTIYLVADHEGALILANDSRAAAKIALAVNGIQFRKRTIKCGDIKDLKNHTATVEPKKNQAATQSNQEVLDEKPSAAPQKSGTMTNEDFRRMFLAK